VKSLFYGVDMADATKRRGLRFRLRTVFAAFTVVAVWLGWNVHLVQQRKAALETMVSRRGKEIRLVGGGTGIYAPDGTGPLSLSRHEPTAPFKVSAVRRLLGDTPRRYIVGKAGCGAELFRLFPEATIFQPE
jgi:hypothetical protein